MKLFLIFPLLIVTTLCHGIKGEDRVRAALLIIDVQDCFLAGGSLAVSDGNDVIPVINRIRQKYGKWFSVTALSKDWHCPGHVSFADSHTGKNVGDVIDLKYQTDGELCLGESITRAAFPMATSCPDYAKTQTLQQHLWPVHCVQNVTNGPTSSKLADSLDVYDDDVIILKGTHCQIDAYSAFFDNGRFDHTVLDNILKSNGINTVFVTGLALDYCVYYTSMDAHSLGYETYTVVDACRGVAQDTVDEAIQKLTNKGVYVIKSEYIGNVLYGSQSNTAVSSKFSSIMAGVLLILGFVMAHLEF